MSRHAKNKHKAVVDFNDLSITQQKERLIADIKIMHNIALHVHQLTEIYQTIIKEYNNNHPIFQTCGCFWYSVFCSTFYTMQMQIIKLYEENSDDNIILETLIQNFETYSKDDVASWNVIHTYALSEDEKNRLEQDNRILQSTITLPFTPASNNQFVAYIHNTEEYNILIKSYVDAHAHQFKRLRTKRNKYLAHNIRDAYSAIHDFLKKHDVSIEDIKDLTRVALRVLSSMHQYLTSRGLPCKITNNYDVAILFEQLMKQPNYTTNNKGETWEN